MPCECSEETSLPSSCHCVELSLRSDEVAHPYCATCFGRCYPNGANLISEQRNLFNGVCQLFVIPLSKGLKDSLESQEEKNQADASGAQNGAPSNSDEEPGIYGRTDPSGSVVVPTNAASGNLVNN
ncbi:unnamed protein product [Musa acuminata subsp. malaccensis]|uniref:(wild Malaysian banana) hypothetical protein n=1 Tax=Musa acuminata subsp. malaccensis TaxID=214687 RepID=A0A804IJ84_MUSAM|nr:unnamed protein product [Musa acuminata subsp. malaccensis]